MTTKIFENIDELSRYFAELVIEKLNQTNDADYFSIALSGGSTPKSVFGILASEYKERINWAKIRMFWGDERCVGPENDESNYKMACEYLLDHVSIPKANIYRIMGEADPKIEAIRYESIVKSKVKVHEGIPQFDLMIQGLGEDGHTASIFPNNLQLFEADELFAATQNPYNKQNRITATGKLINHASRVVFIVCGTQKAQILENMLKHKKEALKYPAYLVNPSTGHLYWLLDKQAATLLI